MDIPRSKQPYIPECEVFYEGKSDSSTFHDNCEKNPGHPTFISVDKLTLEHLPLECQDKRYINDILFWCDRTVKILVNYTSMNRPDTYWNSDVPYPYSEMKGSKRVQRSGTGFVKELIVKKGTPPCPCHLCQECGQPENDYWKVQVHTATHVIYDNEEAFGAVFECFYDSDDRKGVKCLYGVDIKNSNERRYFSDVCVVNCVTHDESLVQRLSSKHATLYNIPVDSYLPSPEWGFIVSHPHGCSKKITIGKIISYSFPLNSKFDKSIPHDFNKQDILRLPSKNYNLTNGFLNLLARLLPFCVRSGSDDSNFSVPTMLAPDTMVPGKEYRLPEGMTYTLPLDSEYYCRAKSIRQDMWTTFPPGTIFTLPDGSDISLPPDAEFNLYLLNGKQPPFDSYMTYEIDTCKGSSGAAVFTYVEDMNDRFQLHAVTHHGALEDKTNRSGIARVSGYILSIPVL